MKCTGCRDDTVQKTVGGTERYRGVSRKVGRWVLVQCEKVRDFFGHAPYLFDHAL